MDLYLTKVDTHTFNTKKCLEKRHKQAWPQTFKLGLPFSVLQHKIANTGFGVSVVIVGTCIADPAHDVYVRGPAMNSSMSKISFLFFFFPFVIKKKSLTITHMTVVKAKIKRSQHNACLTSFYVHSSFFFLRSIFQNTKSTYYLLSLHIYIYRGYSPPLSHRLYLTQETITTEY